MSRALNGIGVKLVVLVLFWAVVAISTPAQKRKSSKIENPAPTNKTPICSPQLQSRFLENRQFLPIVRSYKNRMLRGVSIVDISSLLWQCDRDNSRSTFLEMWQSLETEIEDLERQKKNTATNSQEDVRKIAESIGTTRFLKRYLVWSLSKTDTQLAAQLSKTFTADEKALLDKLSFENNLSAGDFDAQKLNQLRQIMRSNPVSVTIPILFDLRKQSPELADRLYLELLSLRSAGENSLDSVMDLGTYLFTSHLDASIGVTGPYSFSFLPVRGLGRVIELTVERENANGQAIFQYMRLAAAFLQIPVATVTERTRRFVFARMMVGHSQNSIEISSLFVLAAQIHSDGVPDNFKQTNFLEQFSSKVVRRAFEPDYYEESLRVIEKTVGSDERDDRAVHLSHLLYLSGQFEKIERLTEYISNLDRRNVVLDVARYSHALQLIENRKLDNAERVAGKIENPSYRALIGLRLLQSSLDQKRDDMKNGLSQRLYEIAANAEKSDDNYVPLIFFALARIAFREDEGLAAQFVYSAVNKINKTAILTSPEWMVRLPLTKIPVPSVTFRMKKIQGLEVQKSLEFLIKESKTGFEDVVLLIKDEKIQSHAIRIFITEDLAKASKSAIKDRR